jgi:dipeptidyl aminopeptidase/acylaminoacyl peptidase
VSSDRAEKIAIVEVSGDTKPPEYYVYDRGPEADGLPVRGYPALDAKSLAPMKAVRYPGARRARDPGLSHAAARRRDAPADDRHAARRSDRARRVGLGRRCAVPGEPRLRGFQPNFRGSTGFGRDARAQGLPAVGARMQDDLSDGVAWLVAQGIADPDRDRHLRRELRRLCGARGLVKTPELYRAGASFAGVSDMIAWLDDATNTRFSDFNKPCTATRRMIAISSRATSPARHADRVRAPVLIAHGEADPVVAWSSRARWRTRSRAPAPPWRPTTTPTRCTASSTSANRIDFHEKLADFFARNLAPAPRATM